MDNDTTDITFESTIDWANTKTILRSANDNGIPLFYLFIGAFVILVLIILIISLVGSRNQDVNELDMLVDEEYQDALDQNYQNNNQIDQEDDLGDQTEE